MIDISRRQFMATGIGAAAALGLPRWALGADDGAAPGRRPNVIIFWIDDMDLNEIGCFGGKVLTPHMDSLARDGVKFSRGYVVSAVCTPSRYNMVTGGYASRALNLRQNTPPGSWAKLGWNSLVTEEVTLAKILKAGGYRTGMVGKWHLGGDSLTKLPADAKSSDPAVRKTVADNYEKTVAAVKRAGFDFADALVSQNVQGMPLPKDWVVHNQEWMTGCALDFIEQSKDQPFFLYFASTVPHSPYGMSSLTCDPHISTRGLLDKVPQVQPSREDVLRRTREAGVTDKLAFLTWLDDGIGAILKKLADLKLEQDTLILFMSDNANPAKYTCYEGGVHVPAMARWTGRIKPGSVCNAVIGSVDLPATVADVCGVKVPANAQLDGESLLPLLDGRKGPWREGLMLEITYTRGIVTDGWKYVALRFPPHIQAKIDSGEWKKVNQEGEEGPSHYETEDRYPGYFDRDQLYDLKADPKEQRNLAADPAHRAKLDEMKELLRKQSAKLPTPFGEFKAVD